MVYEITKSGIKYDWLIDGPQGGKFKLFPVKGVHNWDKIRESKEELKECFDVIFIEVEWITKEQDEQLALWKSAIPKKVENIADIE